MATTLELGLVLASFALAPQSRAEAAHLVLATPVLASHAERPFARFDLGGGDGEAAAPRELPPVDGDLFLRQAGVGALGLLASDGAFGLFFAAGVVVAFFRTDGEVGPVAGTLMAISVAGILLASPAVAAFAEQWTGNQSPDTTYGFWSAYLGGIAVTAFGLVLLIPLGLIDPTGESALIGAGLTLLRYVGIPLGGTGMATLFREPKPVPLAGGSAPSALELSGHARRFEAARREVIVRVADFVF